MMGEPRGENAGAPSRYWPPHGSPGDAVAVTTSCARCDQPWRIHRDLSGYRLRCVCGGWVRVPFPEAVVRSARAVVVAAAHVAPARRGLSFEALPERALPALDSTDRRPRRPDPQLVPDLIGPTAREIDHGILELAAIAIAFFAPPLVVLFALGPRALESWLPVTSLVGGVLVLLVGLASGGFGFEGLRRARSKHLVESIVAGGAAVGLAIGWKTVLAGAGAEFPELLRPLVETLGTPLALFAIALCPAVFEEIAFRGIVQGRLITLLGTRTGVLLTATAFTLAHGVSATSPLHFILGLYLGTLRLRSGSLVPGMLFHGLYNGTVLLLEALLVR